MTRTLVPFATRVPRRWRDFDREMDDELRRWFDRDWSSGSEAAVGFVPDLNVAETDEGFEVTVDLPGMKPEEFNIEFKDDSLWISGERKCETEEQGKSFHCVERHYGSFRRILRLGTNVDPDSIHADYKDGVLTVSAAKTEAARPKRIEVHT